jgi:hypothetical protein
MDHFLDNLVGIYALILLPEKQENAMDSKPTRVATV